MTQPPGRNTEVEKLAGTANDAIGCFLGTGSCILRGCVWYLAFLVVLLLLGTAFGLIVDLVLR